MSQSRQVYNRYSYDRRTVIDDNAVHCSRRRFVSRAALTVVHQHAHGRDFKSNPTNVVTVVPVNNVSVADANSAPSAFGNAQTKQTSRGNDGNKQLCRARRRNRPAALPQSSHNRDFSVHADLPGSYRQSDVVVHLKMSATKGSIG